MARASSFICRQSCRPRRRPRPPRAAASGGLSARQQGGSTLATPCSRGCPSRTCSRPAGSCRSCRSVGPTLGVAIGAASRSASGCAPGPRAGARRPAARRPASAPGPRAADLRGSVPQSAPAAPAAPGCAVEPAPAESQKTRRSAEGTAAARARQSSGDSAAAAAAAAAVAPAAAAAAQPAAARPTPGARGSVEFRRTMSPRAECAAQWRQRSQRQRSWQPRSSNRPPGQAR
mmetsp:Transcript_38827/g.91166  ORF Transcript_38827/g.91166 Transcript_38827/m.91166 type:complete len:232 (+) Transcript_38827:48-743(+)